MTVTDTDRLNILLIEDNEDDYVIVRDLLRDIGAERFALEWADSYADGLRAIHAHRHDVILLDFRLSDGTGLELLQETQGLSSRPPVIFMTGQGDHAIDVQVMQAGAADYLVKDRLDADLLERAIRYAVERQKSAEALRASEDRYRTFVENSTEGIWRFELEKPMPVEWPEDEQIAHLEHYAYLAECNDAMAHIYGFQHVSEIIGSRFGEFLSPSAVSDDNYLRRLIHTQYRLVNAEAFGHDRYGQPKYVLHNLIGVVENGLLYRIWGSQSDITERKRSENAQAQLAAIVESSDDAIFSKTLDGLIVTWNKGAEALYGYTAQEVTGQSISLISPFQPLEQIKRTQERIQRGERIPQFETVNRHKAGNLFDVSVAVSPIIDAAGHVTGSSTIVRDISERKCAETRLRQSEANMAAAQRIAHIGSWEIELGNQDDINANPLRWSDETFRIFGYEPGSIAVTNDLFFQAVPAEDQPVISSAVAAAIAERQPYSFVHRIRRPDGEERVVHEIAELVGEEGTEQPLKLVGTVHDVTEQRRTEEHSRFQALLLSQVRNAVVATDLAGRIIYWNNFAETLYQWKAEEVLGRNIADITSSPENQSAAEQAMREIRETGSWQGEWVAQRKDGSAFDAYVVDTLFRDFDGRVKGIVGVSVDITERKQAEKALHASEARFRTLVQSSWDGFHLLDPNGQISYESPAATRILGYQPEEMVGHNVLEFIHPDDVDQISATVSSLLEAPNNTRTVVMRVRHKDGSWRWIDSFRSNLLDNPDVGAIAVNYRDITERKQAEEALRQSEKRFRSVVEQVESLVIHDEEGRLIEVNQNACDSLGYTREELLQKRVPDYELNYEQANIAALWKRMAFGEISTLIVDGMHQRKDKSTFPVEVRVGLMETEGPLLMVAVARDVTDRKQAEAERDRFFTLSLDMMAIVSSDGYIKRLNPAFEATLGFSDAELMAKPFLEFVHPDDIPATLVEMANLDSGVQVVRFENRYLCRDGSYKWLRWMSAPYEDLWYCVAHDVTAIRQATAALIQANDELESRVVERTTQLESSHREMSIAKEEAERANAAKSDFLSRMSHELRTPMNSILGFAQIMEMDAPSDKQAIRIRHIIKAGQHLLQLINEVLDLARVESGRLQLSLEPVSVSVCLQSAIDMIRPLCEQHDQQIICDFSAWESLYVRADQQRLSQVLINLLSNATKYGRDGGVILVNCKPSREGWQQISISDSGAGIPAEQLAKLFQPFERLGADRRPIEGTGLGLALSKRLVELMGGRISVQSVVGSGSTFVIELPHAKYSSQEIETLPSLPALPGADGRQYTILYIEDNLANLQLIEHVLAGHPQYHLRSAMGGLSGLDMAQDLSPSVIVLDLHLPDLPGDEVLAHLKADPFMRDIPVVIVSADATPGQIRRLLAAGAADYLTKPLDLRLFKDVLHKILLPKEEMSG